MTEPREWTAADTALLRDLYIEGKSLAYLADRFHTSPGAVKQKLHREGIKRPASATSQGHPPRKPKAPDDIATRLAVLLGQEPRPVAPRREIPDEDLLRYAGERTPPPEALGGLWERVRPHILRHPLPDPEAAALGKLWGLLAFSKELLDVEPQDYQACAVYLVLSHKNAVVVSGRQVGKDWVAALFTVWESLTRPNARTVIVSEAQRQSDMLAERAMAFIARSAEVFDSVADSSRERLRFRNGSEVYFLPATGAIRGLTEVTRVIANEARGIPDETYDAVTPMLARLGGSLVLFSTPLGRQGRLFDFYSNSSFAAMQLPSTVNQYLDKSFLEGEKLRMDSDSYQREYLGEFSDIYGAFFSTRLIEKARKEYTMAEVREEGKIYAIGFDPARVRDSSVVTVVSEDPAGDLRIEAIRDFVDVPFSEQLPVVRWLTQTFKPRKVVVEYSGLGMGPCEELERLGLPVERLIPTVSSKMEAYGHLKNLIERGKLTIPASHTKLAVELKMFQFKVTESGNITLHHLAGQGDDFADSLCFATYGLKVMGRAGFVPVQISSPGMPDTRGRPQPTVFRQIMGQIGLWSDEDVRKDAESRARSKARMEEHRRARGLPPLPQEAPQAGENAELRKLMCPKCQQTFTDEHARNCHVRDDHAPA